MREQVGYRLDLGVGETCLPVPDVSPAISVYSGLLFKPDACPLTVEKAYKPFLYHN